jgi:hypothetical protein
MCVPLCTKRGVIQGKRANEANADFMRAASDILLGGAENSATRTTRLHRPVLDSRARTRKLQSDGVVNRIEDGARTGSHFAVLAREDAVDTRRHMFGQCGNALPKRGARSRRLTQVAMLSIPLPDFVLAKPMPNAVGSGSKRLSALKHV